MIKVLLAVVICWLKIRLVCGSACSGQFFEIELKRRSKFCLQWSFLAKNCLVLLAVASILVFYV